MLNTLNVFNVFNFSSRRKRDKMPIVSFTSLNNIQRSISLTSYKYDLHKPRENEDVVLDINENEILDEQHLKSATFGQKKSFKRSISSILTAKTTDIKNVQRSKSLNYLRKVTSNESIPGLASTVRS